MLIVHHTHLPCEASPGARTSTVADRSGDISAFEVRLIELDPGARLPPSVHAGEMAVLALAGQGKLHLASGPQRFAAPCSLFIPPHAPYQILNSASTALQLVMVCTEAPRLSP